MKTYLNRWIPVKIGAADSVVRSLAEEMSKSLGQPGCSWPPRPAWSV
jgi:hypothetical protein